jgi:STE24 endopeptidase
LTIAGIYRMQISRETVKANAMLAGLGRTRRVILGDTLLDGFAPEEIEVVLAHEVGHHVHRHILLLLIGTGAFSLVAFWVCDLVLRQYVSGIDGEVQYAPLSLAALPLMMLIISVLSALSGPLRCAMSRRFERQCDRYALRQTGLSDAFRSAFRKLAALNKADPDPHPLEVFLFHDHPTISQRLALATEYEGGRKRR